MRRAVTMTALFFVAAACDGRGGPATSPTPSVAESATTPDQPMSFDRLSMDLHLGKSSVPSGGQIDSEIEVSNRSERAVVDPGCLLHAFSFGLVPADDPNAELWGQVIVDCAGRSVMGPGYTDRFAGPTFRATDKFGDPLPPGDYVAMVRFERRSEPLAVPVQITP